MPASLHYHTTNPPPKNFSALHCTELHANIALHTSIWPVQYFREVQCSAEQWIGGGTQEAAKDCKPSAGKKPPVGQLNFLVSNNMDNYNNMIDISQISLFPRELVSCRNVATFGSTGNVSLHSVNMHSVCTKVGLNTQKLHQLLDYSLSIFRYIFNISITFLVNIFKLNFPISTY